MKGQRRLGKIREQYHGNLTGRGKNITEAKADLAKQIDNALEGSYVPVLVHVANSPLAALVWRDLRGWQYTLIGLRNASTGTGIHLPSNCCGSPKGDTQADVEQSARKHLAQCILKIDGRTGMEVLICENDRDDHKDYVKWQYTYKAWRLHGATDNEARHACHKMPAGYVLVWSNDLTTARLVCP